jgi:gliding motility-associated-like protein
MDLQVFGLPMVNAGSDEETCQDTPFDLSSSGIQPSASNYSSLIWTASVSGGYFDDPSNLWPIYTPPSGYNGTIILTLRANGNGSCPYITDDMTLTITPKPVVNAGNDTVICYGSDITLNGSISNYSSFSWRKGMGDGWFDNEFILNATYTPGPNDLLTGYVVLYLDAMGTGSCGIVTDSVTITIPSELIATIGAPTPFFIGPNTQISVSVKVENHEAIHDLSYYLQAPDGTRVPLKVATNFLTCNYGDGADITFTNDPSFDTLDICTIPFFPGVPLTGTYRATGDFSALYGKDPANGAWSVVITDCNYNVFSPTDGELTYASISFTDTSYLGYLETVMYESGTINQPIYQSDVYSCAETRYISPIGLKTKCYGSCDATGLVTVVGGTPPYVDFIWSPMPAGGNGTDSVLLCEGTYTLTVVDAMGCIAQTSVNVTSPLPITYKSFKSTDSLNCYGDANGEIRVKAIGGTGKLRYYLLPGNIPSSVADSGVFTNLSAGTYTVHIEDVHNCYKDTTITIYEPPQFRIQSVIVDSLLCSGDSDGIIRVTAEGGKAPYKYWITPGTEINNDGVFENLSQGSYVIKITDASTCGDTLITDTILMNAPSPLIIDSVTVGPVVCNGGRGSITIHVSGGTLPYEGSIDGGGSFTSSLTFSNLIAGSYTPAVRDNNSCITVYPVPVNIINPPPIQIDSISITDVTGCFGDSNGSLYVSASGGWNNIEYSLDGVQYQTENLFSNITGGSKTLYIRDSLGCILTIDTIVVNQPPQLVVAVIKTDVFSSTLGTIRLIASGGTPPYVYSIDNGATTQDSGYFINLVPGLYDIFVQDANNCIFTDTVRIIINELNMMITKEDISCFGEQDGSILISALNGVPPYQLILGPDTFPPSNEGTYAFRSMPAGSYPFKIEDSEGRFFIDTIIINEPEDILINEIITRPQCSRNTNDGSIILTISGGNGGYRYFWSNGAVSKDLANIDEGVYSVRVEDSKGCSKTEDYNVLAMYYAIADAGWDTTICHGEAYFLNGSAWSFDSVRWTSSNLISNPTISNPYSYITSRTEFIYTVYYHSCWDKDTVVIDVHPLIGINIIDSAGVLTFDTTLFLLSGQTVTLTTDNQFSSYRWSPSQYISGGDTTERSITIDPAQSITYTVRGYNAFGCVERDSVKVVIAQPINEIYSGFTPNGDGVNDRWVIPHAIEYGDKIEVQIFNRWGERIYHSRGYGGEKEWDGTFKGKPLPVATYYYIITIDDKDTKPFTGTVTIIR